MRLRGLQRTLLLDIYEYGHGEIKFSDEDLGSYVYDNVHPDLVVNAFHCLVDKGFLIEIKDSLGYGHGFHTLSQKGSDFVYRSLDQTVGAGRIR